MTSTPRRRLNVILNRESGTLQKLGAHAVETRLREILEEEGCEVTIRLVTGSEVPAAANAAAKDDQADAVIIGGGDGSVAAAATALAGTGATLGVLPLGTFNLAARDVGMPVDFEEAARLLPTAPSGDMDLLDIHGRLYLCVVVLGFYPAFAMGRPEYHGSWLVKTWRTLVDALLHAATFPPLDLRLNDGEAERRHRTRIVLLANNDYEDIFGIIPARRSLDAGYFTVYISKHRSQFGLLKSALRWLIGRWKQDREILVLRTSELEIGVRNKTHLAVMMDGELAKIAVPFKVTLRPKAVRLIAPRLAEPRETEASALASSAV